MSQKGLKLTNGVWQNYDITTSNDVGYNDFIQNAKLEKVVDNTPERSVFKATDDISSSAYDGAFDNVIPYWITQKDKEDKNVFTIPESEPFTYSTIDKFGYDYPTYQLPKKEEPSKFITKLGEFGTAIKEKTKGFFEKPISFLPGGSIAGLIHKATRPNANESFRGVAGLYSREVSLMSSYGSIKPTEGNPTGDPRKDDAGFNIISGAGNYNMLGTNSRRHNMLMAANIYEKNSKEWKNERNKIREDFEEEKKTGIINNTYNIDSSGSHGKDKTPPKQNGDGQTKTTSKTKSVVARSAPSQYREGGGEHGGGSVTPAQAGMVGKYDGGLT
tara:strand:+ start:215 stop:1204 length:990 start_codon:yes stop_codon:yes gene_type:complete